MNVSNTLTDALNYLRHTEGMSQMELSKQLGVTQTTISRWMKKELPPNVKAVVGAIDLANRLQTDETTI